MQLFTVRKNVLLSVTETIIDFNTIYFEGMFKYYYYN